jgi:hypothetical protein
MYVVAPSGYTEVLTGAAPVWLNFDVLDILRDAKANGVNANFLVKDNTESFDGTERYSYHRSKEYTTDLTIRSKLTVEYYIFSYDIASRFFLSIPFLDVSSRFYLKETVFRRYCYQVLFSFTNWWSCHFGSQ